MCGIGGVLYLDARHADDRVLGRMALSVAHRGPDDSGVWTDGPAGLLNRRLAIIDLSSAGRQPMSSEDGSVVVSYNGEIFNFRELREELVAAGHRFRSRTDTEVVVHAFQEWSEGTVRRFNGQFAFAIWDGPRRRMLLARDRLGIKPLYYWLDAGKLVFGSEIRAILAHPGIPRRLCYGALDEYFTFQNILDDRTLFDGIRLLAPGTWLSVAADGASRVHEYWDAKPRRPGTILDMSLETTEVRRALERAVESQLVSDVPIGSYLSGGIDSASVAAIARRSLGRLPTFTLGFDLTAVQGRERDFDERATARATARVLGTEHHETTLRHEDMERSIADVVWHLEELRVGQSYPNYAVAAFARPSVKVVLSGTGGDELFAGYPWRYAAAITASGPDDFVARSYGQWQRLIRDDEKAAFFRPDLPRGDDGATLQAFRAILERAGTALRDTPDFLDASLYFDLKAFLHGLLVVEDKVSMAHGLEVRVPFLDNDLVDLALRIPPAQKLRTGTVASGDPGARTADGKVVLREAVRALLGDDVVDRPKQGFSAPDATWFRGASRAFVSDALLDPRARIYEVIQPHFVRRSLEEHWAGRRDRRLLIWSLIAFDRWLGLFEVTT